MLNKVMIIGRLGKNPEIRYSQDGLPIVGFSVATTEYTKDKEGNRTERTEWHTVSVFGKQAESCNTYLAKGSLVYIEGSLRTNKWQDKEGKDRYTTQVIAQTVRFLDRKSDSPSGGENSSQATYNNNASYTNNSSQQSEYSSPFPSEAHSEHDDIPF